MRDRDDRELERGRATATATEEHHERLEPGERPAGNLRVERVERVERERAEPGSAPLGARTERDHPSHLADPEGAARMRTEEGRSEDRLEALLSDHDLHAFRSRWDEIQTGFVDSPRDAVQHADRLVEDLMGRLSEGFSNARSELEQQWSRGEDASTEDLRQALRRYRSFFQRLLSV